MYDSHVKCTTTRWTLVWRAASEDSDSGRPALEQFIVRYWKPLYSFARQRGLSSADAEDATQEFLSGVLDREWLLRADPARGRFRTYLLTSWKHFLVDQYRKKNRQRRGGDARTFSLDVNSSEREFQIISAQQPNADHFFTLAWANSILEETHQRLAAEYAKRGSHDLHQALSPHLTSPIDHSTYQGLSKQLGLSLSALRVALHRLRQRFGQTLREVVEETVEHPSEVDEELQELLKLMTSA